MIIIIHMPSINGVFNRLLLVMKTDIFRFKRVFWIQFCCFAIRKSDNYVPYIIRKFSWNLKSSVSIYT